MDLGGCWEMFYLLGIFWVMDICFVVIWLSILVDNKVVFSG